MNYAEEAGMEVVIPHPPESWSVVADELLDRLQKQKTITGSRDWRRDGLSNLAIQALEKSGRGDEVIPLCGREAKLTKSYDRLVLRLMEAGRIKELLPRRFRTGNRRGGQAARPRSGAGHLAKNGRGGNSLDQTGRLPDGGDIFEESRKTYERLTA